MKWFKHYTDNHRGRSIQDLLDKLGHTGLCYYLLVEMCAEKLEKDDKGLTDADCLFSFHVRVVRQNLRISPINLRHLLGICATNGLLSFELSGNSLQISMPILLDLLDHNTKKAQLTRKKYAIKSPLDKEIDKDKEIDEDKDKDKEIDLTSEAKKPEIKIPSTHISRAAIRGCIPEFENCLITKKYFDECSQEVQRSWIDAYPSVEFIQTECRKANSWILSNPQKAPKKFQRFFNNWLSKAFESYRKGIPSRRLTNSELNQESLKDLYKKVQEEKI